MTRIDHPGSCLRHKRYRLNCAEFLVLLADCGERCAICNITGAEARPPYLVIDHDHHVGDWAIRGMICSGCNRRIRDKGTPPPAEAAHYLANPWYLRRETAWMVKRGLVAARAS